jgi:hypothetical protein
VKSGGELNNTSVGQLAWKREGRVQAKLFFAGEGVNIPGLDIGFGFSGVKLWVGPPFVGYTIQP